MGQSYDDIKEYVDVRDNLIRFEFADADTILRKRIENVSSLLNETTESIESKYETQKIHQFAGKCHLYV